MLSTLCTRSRTVLRQGGNASSAIRLDAQEQQLCRLLVDVAQYVARKRPDLPPVTLRIAGGWVRDHVKPHYCYLLLNTFIIVFFNSVDNNIII